MMRLTKPQQESLKRKWMFWNENESYLKFRRDVQEVFMGEGAVCVRWNGMWLVIESDGYTHS
jgi:hypothetical protein